MTKPHKNAVGDQIAPSARIQKRKIGMANIKLNYKKLHPNQNYRNHRLEDPRF